MKRTYRKPQASGQYCEHCDSPEPQPTRLDYLRGWVCRGCDTALDAIEREEVRHEHGKPCPLTGEPIPQEQIFTEHSRPGCFNACGACSSDKRTVAERLRDLAEERKPKAATVCPLCLDDLGETIRVPSGKVCPGCGTFEAP